MARPSALGRLLLLAAAVTAALFATHAAFALGSAGRAAGVERSQLQALANAGAALPAAAQTSSAASAGAALVAGAAVVALAAAARRRRCAPASTQLQALGSIDQFRVFGPPEDPFEIQTDKVLGVGGQGTVYICHKVNNPAQEFAVKTIPIWRLLMDPSCDEKIAAIEQEVDVLERVQGHENICACAGCYDAFRPGTTQAQYKMMVMEKLNGGELASYISEGGPLNEDIARNVFRQTCEGLKHIHAQQVLHRDLKCENILVCDQNLTAQSKVKLIDFGVAKAIHQSFARSCVGTTEIMAPELVCAKMMIAPKGVVHNTHGPYDFKLELGPGFGIQSQRPDGKGAMVNGVEPGGQAETMGIGDGWAISKINGDDITEMPFVKDFNELGAGTKGGVTAIAEILGNLSGDFTMEFVELPKREFSEAVDLWSLGVVLYCMLAGKTPFKDEEDIANGEVNWDALASVRNPPKDLMWHLLQLDPAKRITLDQAMQHPWVTGAA